MLIFNPQVHIDIQLPLGVKAMKKSTAIALFLAAAMAASSFGSDTADAAPAPAPAPAPTTATESWTLKATGTGLTEPAAQTNCADLLEEHYNTDVDNGVIACPAGSSPLAGTPNCSNCSENSEALEPWSCPGTLIVTCEPYY
jgi:hypothetical protein